MPTLDYKLAIETQAWALLEANATFTSGCQIQCRLKDDVKAAMQANLLVAPNDKQFQTRIEVGECQSIARNAIRVFGMNRTPFTYSDVDVPVPAQCKLTVSLLFDAAYPKAARFAADNLVRGIFLAKYPKFGLSYCADFTISDTKRKGVTVEGQSGQIVWQQVVTFLLRPYLSQLVA